MAVTVKIAVANIADVLETYDEIKIYRSTTGLTGVYTEVTVPANRPQLLAGKTVYSFVDTTGISTYYYEVSFYSSATMLESSRSDPVQGEADPALDIISVDELKEIFLFGVDLTDDQGNEFPDTIFEFYIKAAASWLERNLNIPLRPLIVEEERHDFYRRDYQSWIWLQLLNVPVINVDSIKLVLPTNQQVIEYNPDWIYVDKPSGQVNIVPGSGQLLLGTAAAWLPLLTGWVDFVPDVFRVRYTAGFERGKVPDELREMVGKLAAFGPLNIAGDLVFGAGLAGQSVSLDGLVTSLETTQSATNAGYGARLIEYWREIKMALPELRRYYKGARFIVA